MADKYDEYTKAELLRLIRKRDHKPRFGLVWERDEIDHDRSINADFVTLEYDEALSCGTGPYTNLLIEADNFDALRYLRMTHKGKIKCIYIDPPYNTGNKDFIYNDSFVEKDDLFKHSKWIEYMYRRLVLAKDLLAPDGVIFASINYIEMANLKLLMDDVFDEKNRLVDFVWHTDGNFDNQGRFKVCHEYILAYSANEKLVPPPPVIDPNADEGSKLFKDEIRNTIVKNGPKNPVSEIVLEPGFPASFESGVIKARSDKWPHIDTDAIVKNWELQNRVTVSSGWANKNLCERFIATHFHPVLDSKNQLTTFELTSNGAIENVKSRLDDQSHVVSVIKNVGSVQATGDHLTAQGIAFTYPKPVGLIKYLLSMIEGNDHLVLDFFAGSATTAHAVMALNAEDKGTRRWIMISSTEATADFPEKNICKDVARQRLENAINGYTYKTKSGLNNQKGLGGNFAYVRTKRIPATHVFRRIEHEQVWLALQLIHTDTITSYQPKSSIYTTTNSGKTIVYVPKVTDSTLDEISDLTSNVDEVTVYSWTPAVLRQRLEEQKITFEPIPQYLVDRFAVGVKK